MASLNKVTIIGRLGRDPEIRTTPSGTTVTNFTVATNENWKDKDGKKQESVEWHRVVAFGKLGDICGKYLNKGGQVYIEGRLQTRKWESEDEVDKYTTEIIAREMKMLGSKAEKPPEQYAPEDQPPLNKPLIDDLGENPYNDDDIPDDGDCPF